MDSSTLKRLLTLVSAPLVWIVHFVVCYVIVALVCASQLDETRFIGLNAVELGVAASTLLAGALIIGIAVVSQRRWRHPPGPDPDISRFFAISTLLLCAISLLSMLWVAFPTSMLPTCAS
ncbi:hypothetical protein [Massilia consociata]|uniref:Transmembrane protein n=1 Tax=Massilia consociata TaxID=760117 RepID=A0ABV6FK03_9BURK